MFQEMIDSSQVYIVIDHSHVAASQNQVHLDTGYIPQPSRLILKRVLLSNNI